MTNPTLGTVGQADLINATGLPISTGVAGLGTGIATFLGTPSSANLRTAVTDETGTGSLVFATSPTLVTPNLGTPSVLVATNATGTAVGLTAGSAITNANLTGAVTSVGNATSLGSFTSAQLRTALTDETGAGSAVFAASPTITAPILNQINDTNNAQILGLSPTTSAVDYLVAKNGIGVGVPLHFYADGSSANIGLHIQPKGTGLVTISDGTDFNKGIRFRSSGSAASAVTLLDAVSTAGRVVTLPDATTTLVGRDTTDTLTNKTIAFSSNTFSGTLAIANGGTNASTAASAIENLLPAYTGNGSKALKLNSGATALEWVADGGGTVTSVGGTGTVNGITLTGTVTTSGNLTLGGTLSGVSLTSQVTGTLPTANGGTNLTSFTSGGVVYASSSSALATGSALTFDGTNLALGRTALAARILTVQGRACFTSTANDSQLAIYSDGSTNGLYSTYNSTGSYLPMAFFINDVEQMRLTSTGLGIGTSSPATALDVQAANGQSIIRLTATTGTNPVYSRASNTGGFLYIGRDGSTGSDFGSAYAAGIWSTGAYPMLFGTNGTEKMRLNSAGILGIGVNPSAWVGSLALQVNGVGAFYSDGITYDYTTGVANNCYQTGNGTWAYRIAATNAARYEQNSNSHRWFVSSGAPTAGGAVSFTQAMSLDAGGRLLVGTTSGSEKINVASVGNQSAGAEFAGNGSAIGTGSLFVGQGSTGDAFVYNRGNTPLIFATNSTERARIDTSGNLLVGTTSFSITAAGTRITADGSLSVNRDGNDVARFNRLTNDGVIVYFAQGGTDKGSVSIAGSVTSYNVTSDQRLKENIQNASDFGSVIDSIQVRSFNWKSDSAHQRAGFIAQELVTVAPEAVYQPTDTEQMMAVDYSKLVPMLVKEIQSLRQRLSAANL
jgi:hypothetical protein